MDSGIVYHPPEVIQERNYHHLHSDFQDEIPGYLNNEIIVDLLGDLRLKPGLDNILDNLRRCYEVLVANDIFPDRELLLVDAWCRQIELSEATYT